MAILVYTTEGKLVKKQTLEQARTSLDCSGKTIVVTSRLTTAQSNITAPWPMDRELKVVKGGSIHPDNGLFNGLSYAEPQWFGAIGYAGNTVAEADRPDDTVAFQLCLNSLNWTVDTLPDAAPGHWYPPLKYPYGGTIYIPAGMYKITSTLHMRRGTKIIGAGREATQIRTYIVGGLDGNGEQINGSTFYYRDAGSDFLDAISIESLSIMQTSANDVAVTLTSGAAIAIIGIKPDLENPANINPDSMPRIKDVNIRATYVGIYMDSVIAASISDVFVTLTKFHGVMVRRGGGVVSTSINFFNTYCSSSFTGSGFYIQSSSYCNLSGVASDSNARFGYEFDGNTGMNFHGGAEFNITGAMQLSDARTSNIDLTAYVQDAQHGIVMGGSVIVPLLDGNGNPTVDVDGNIVMDPVPAELPGNQGCRILACLSSNDPSVEFPEATMGYAIYCAPLGTGNASVSSTEIVMTTDGIFNTTHFCNLNTPGMLIKHPFGGAFTGGQYKTWAFGDNDGARDLSNVLIGGTTEAFSPDGLVVAPYFSAAFTSNTTTKTIFRGLGGNYQTAKTFGVAIAQSIMNAELGEIVVDPEISTVPVPNTAQRVIGTYIEEQTGGTSANANISINTPVPSDGNWNIFSSSTRDSMFAGPFRLGSYTGPTIRSGTGSPESVVYAAVGSLYIRTNGGAGTCLYVKESGTESTNTGWIAK